MDVARPVLLGAVSVFGVIGQCLTLRMLRRLKNTINKSLDPTTRRLMVSQAWCELILFAVALPLAIWNKSSGNVWPFTLPGVCYYRRVQFGCSHVSCWHLTVMAALRFAAVFAPNVHARVMKKTGVSIFVVLTPWLFANLLSVFGYAFSFYRCSYDINTGVCDIEPAELTDRSIQKLHVLFAVDGMFNTLLPTISALLMYVAVLVKLYVRKRNPVGVYPPPKKTAVTIGRLFWIKSGAGDAPVHYSANAGLASSKQTGLASANTAVNAANHNISGVRRFDTVKIVAFACFANIALLYPSMIVFMSGSMLNINTKYPLLGLLLDVSHFSAFCVTPLVYAASSRDMRKVYKQLCKELLGFWTCSMKNQHQDQQQPTLPSVAQPTKPTSLLSGVNGQKTS